VFIVFHDEPLLFFGREHRQIAKHGPAPEDLWTQERVHKLRTSTNHFSKSPVSDLSRQFEEKNCVSLLFWRLKIASLTHDLSPDSRPKTQIIPDFLGSVYRLDLGYQLFFSFLEFWSFCIEKSDAPTQKAQNWKLWAAIIGRQDFFRDSDICRNVWCENEGNRRLLLFCVVWDRAAISRYVF
jgi:hypothetical protein